MFRKVFNSSTFVFWLAFGVIVIKIILLPYAQTTDADAVSRTFLSVSWKNNPTWIITGMWAPFHFYFNGLFLGISENIVYTIPVVNIIFSAFTLLPFYYFTKREFNSNGAIVAAIFFAISPVLFRISFMALSEIPYLFFLAMTVNLISKGIRENKNIYIILAGFSITIASGFRYESWIITFLIFCLFLYGKKSKEGFTFAFVAAVFPVIWLIQSWYATGDPLISFKWAKDAYNNNGFAGIESLLRRLWFFPFSWFIALGPPIAFIVVKNIFKVYKSNRNRSFSIEWGLIFFAMLLVFEYNCFRGALLLHHRITGTLVLFSLPFIADYFKEINTAKIRFAVISSLLMIGLTFVYNTDAIKPLPRLKDQSANNISDIIRANITSVSCLIIDFIGWENTYYIALNSGINSGNIIILPNDENNNEFISSADISSAIDKYEKGIIIFHSDSKLFYKSAFKEGLLAFDFYPAIVIAEKIYSDKKCVILKWRK